MKELNFDIQRFVETIYGTDNNDYLKVKADNIVVYGYGGNDSVWNFDYDNVTIFGGEGNDSIDVGNSNWSANNVFISGDSDDDVITLLGSNGTVSGGTGNDNIFVGYNGRNNSINGGIGKDEITSRGANATIIGGSDNDKLYSRRGNYVYISGDDGEDYIYSEEGQEISLIGGNDNDTLLSRDNANGSIIGGNGDDSIKIWSSSNNTTINAGIGNDTVSIDSSSVIIEYSNGDGNDTIFGIDSNDTLEISGAGYSTVKSGNDIKINVGDGSILVKDKSGIDFTINGTLESNPTTNKVVSVSDKVNVTGVLNAVAVEGKNAVLLTDESKVTVTDGAGKIFKFKNEYTNGEINMSISENEVNISEDGYYIATGKNAKVVFSDYKGNEENVLVALFNGDFNNTTGHGLSFYGDIKELDASGYTKAAQLAGNNGNNVIIAGSGNSTMWGGYDGDDTLIGGASEDVFLYAMGDDNDVVQGAGKEDQIVLSGITIDQFTKFAEDLFVGNDVRFETTDGGSLTVKDGKSSGSTYVVCGEKFVVDGDHWKKVE